MRQRFTVRLLDAADRLLAWADVWATAKPQDRPAASCPFFAPGPTTLVIDEAGLAVKLSIHWPDLDVARVQALMEPLAVEVGRVVQFHWFEPVWLVPGMRDVPLPAVTVRQPVAVAVPAGGLNAITP